MIARGWMFLLIFFLMVVFSGIADAKLIKIGTVTYNGKDYGLIYEDDQGLIWMDYSNDLHITLGDDPWCRPCWDNQMKWAGTLNDTDILIYRFNPSISVAWEGPWRLPKAIDGARQWGFDGTTTAGYNITTSEMGHLFYVSLGNVGYYDKDGNARPGWGGPEDKIGWGLKNTGPFKNLQANGYWTCTEFSADPVHAWDFNMYMGSQDGSVPLKNCYSWLGLAVRPAKVAGAVN